MRRAAAGERRDRAQILAGELVALAGDRHLVGLQPAVPGAYDQVRSYAGASAQAPVRSIVKAMFFTWSSWLRATTLNTMRRKSCSASTAVEAEAPAERERLLVGVEPGLVVVDVLERRDRLHVQLAAIYASKRRVMKCRRPCSSRSRHSVNSMPASRAISAYAYSTAPQPSGSLRPWSPARRTPSNFRSQ